MASSQAIPEPMSSSPLPNRYRCKCLCRSDTDPSRFCRPYTRLKYILLIYIRRPRRHLLSYHTPSNSNHTTPIGPHSITTSTSLASSILKQQLCYHVPSPPQNPLSSLGDISRLSSASPVVSTSEVPPPIVPGTPAPLPSLPLSPIDGRTARSTRRPGEIRIQVRVTRSPAPPTFVKKSVRVSSKSSRFSFLHYQNLLLPLLSWPQYPTLPIFHVIFHHFLAS
jgi:hypothetical protein